MKELAKSKARQDLAKNNMQPLQQGNMSNMPQQGMMPQLAPMGQQGMMGPSPMMANQLFGNTGITGGMNFNGQMPQQQNIMPQTMFSGGMANKRPFGM